MKKMFTPRIIAINMSQMANFLFSADDSKKNTV